MSTAAPAPKASLSCLMFAETLERRALDLAKANDGKLQQMWALVAEMIQKEPRTYDTELFAEHLQELFREHAAVNNCRCMGRDQHRHAEECNSAVWERVCWMVRIELEDFAQH